MTTTSRPPRSATAPAGRAPRPRRSRMARREAVAGYLFISPWIVGFLIFTELLGIGDNEIFDLGGLIGAIIGAMILLGIYRMVAKPDRGRERHAGVR